MYENAGPAGAARVSRYPGMPVEPSDENRPVHTGTRTGRSDHA
jgi:hypothetical protein